MTEKVYKAHDSLPPPHAIIMLADRKLGVLTSMQMVKKRNRHNELSETYKDQVVGYVSDAQHEEVTEDQRSITQTESSPRKRRECRT